jgi:hypothetical protein
MQASPRCTGTRASTRTCGAFTPHSCVVPLVSATPCTFGCVALSFRRTRLFSVTRHAEPMCCGFISFSALCRYNDYQDVVLSVWAGWVGNGRNWPVGHSAALSLLGAAGVVAAAPAAYISQAYSSGQGSSLNNLTPSSVLACCPVGGAWCVVRAVLVCFAASRGGIHLCQRLGTCFCLFDPCFAGGLV